MSMKIGIFTETFLPQINGVVTSICNINKVMIGRGHEVSIFTVGEGPTTIDGYTIHRFAGATFKPYPEYNFLLPNHAQWATLIQQPLDIIHSRTPFPLGVMAKQLSKKMNVPIVGTFDTPIYDYIHYVPVFGSIQPTEYMLSGLAKRWLRYYYGMCDVLTVPSYATKEQLIKQGFKVKIEVLSNGVDTKRFNPKKFDKKLKQKICVKGELFILHVGRVTKEKSVDSLLYVAKKLREEKIKFKLVIIGKGPMFRKLVIMSARLGLQDNVIFAGFVENKDLPKYYATADIFLTDSTVETQGIVLLESLASGTPVIGANAGAIPELVKNAETGYLSKPGDIDDMVSKIKTLKDKDAFKDNCLNAVKPHSIDSVASQLESIYKTLITNR